MKKILGLSIIALMLMLCFCALADDTVTFSTDKTEYLIGEWITVTLSAPEGTTYTVSCGNSIYPGTVSEYNNSMTVSSSSLNSGENVITCKYKLPGGETEQLSIRATVNIVVYGSASMTASLSSEEIVQGGELFLNATSLDHVRSITVIVQKYPSQSQVYQRNWNVSGQNSTQIGIQTNVLSPGTYSIRVLAEGEPGYLNDWSFPSTVLTVNQNPDIDDTEIYIDCPDTIQVGEEAFITATAANATVTMQMEYTDEQWGASTTSGYNGASGTGFCFSYFFFTAHQTGTATLTVTAKVGAQSKTKTKSITVTGAEGLKITSIEAPENVWKGNSFSIHVSKPSRAEELEVALYSNNSELEKVRLTEDYQKTITAELTDGTISISYTASAYYNGKIVSTVYGYTWIQDPEDFGLIRFYGSQWSGVRERTVEQGEAVWFLFEPTSSGLEAAQWVVNGVDDKAIVNVGDGAQTTRSLSWDQAGTYTITVKMKIFGDWVTLSPVTVHVESKDEPTDPPTDPPADDPTPPPADETTVPPADTEVPTGPYTDPNGSGSYNIVDVNNATYTSPAGSAATVSIPATITVNGRELKITAIADKAFQKDKKLTTVTIGKNVKTIGRNAFAGCAKLKIVKGGAAVITIKDSAFSGCKALKTFPAMNKLQKIGANAFKGDKALVRFTLAKSVNSIGKNAFNGCAGLKIITVKAEKLTSKNVGTGAFKGINKKATFKCPKKQLKDYAKLFVKKGAPKTCKFK